MFHHIESFKNHSSIPKRLCFAVLIFLLAQSAFAFTNIYTVSEDPADSPDYSSLNDAVEDATCGDLVLVHPGNYSDDGASTDTLTIDGSTSGLTKDCAGQDRLTIAAMNAAVDRWVDSETGAGDLHSDCVLDTTTHDVTCDRSVVSYIERIRNTGDVSHLRIVGFEAHRIDLNGCDDCVIERNFLNVNFMRCLSMLYSDGAEIRGNHLYRCGGDDTGDQDYGGTGSVNQQIHHNNLYGTGEANGDGLNDAACAEDGWQTCTEDFHGTDGYTVSNKNECGTHFYRNKVYDHAERYDDDGATDDGDAIDLKALDCSSNPVHIYRNEFWGQQGDSQILFHNAAQGVRFYSNIVRDGDQSGIFFQAGQRCDEAGFTAMADYRIFNNVIRNNGEKGLYAWKDCDDPSVEQPDLSDIRVFNNLFIENGDAGLDIRWITDDGREYGTSDALTSDAWSIANNIFLNNGLANPSLGEAYDVILKDAYDDETSSTIQLEDYFTFANNIVGGRIHFIKTYWDDEDSVYSAVEEFDAAGYGSDDSSTAPDFIDAASHDYRLAPTSHGIDLALNFQSLLETADLADLPISDFAGGRRPEQNLNDIGPWEECADFDGDGLGICIDPQEGKPNPWYWINSDTSGAILSPAPAYHFVAGSAAAPEDWRGTTLYSRGVKVRGITDESAAQATVFGLLLGTPDDFGIAVERQ